MFNLGPTVEVTVLVHDFLITTLLAYFCLSCSHMGHEERSRVKGRLLCNRYNRNRGAPLCNASVRSRSFDSVLDTKEVAVKDPDICRGPLNVLFSIPISSGLFAFNALVFAYERAFLRAGGVASLVGPTGGDAVGTG